MKPLLTILGLAVLTACGADGEPVQPTLNTVIGLSSSGAYGAGSVGFNQGPVSLIVGF